METPQVAATTYVQIFGQTGGRRGGQTGGHTGGRTGDQASVAADRSAGQAFGCGSCSFCPYLLMVLVSGVSEYGMKTSPFLFYYIYYISFCRLRMSFI